MATGLNAGCCSISRPPLDFTYKPANHPDWSDKPGFWDPYAVIEICLPTITRSVYPATRTMQLEKPTFEHPCGQEIVDGEICWGIQMYTETWKYDECVERAVQRYICFPCRMELEECISLKPERALAVLLTYLRQRGPFLVWMYRGKETAHTIGRYLARTAIQNISQLPVLERSSVIALGRHLSHLLRIACGHRLINMPKIVSKVWGPIFIKVENDKDAFPQVNLTEEEKLGVAIEVCQSSGIGLLDECSKYYIIWWQGSKPWRNFSPNPANSIGPLPILCTADWWISTSGHCRTSPSSCRL
uniref:PH domain-containing protein n=1 Tax=Mesocestoides corti TaxID=53468 RepID=A0A5K3F6P6_MESCO